VQSGSLIPRMKLPSLGLIGRLGWTTFGFGYAQAVRVVGNIIMTRLLAPEVFGVMLIANTLRTGMEQLSDIGVGQNIVADRRGEEAEFYNTAWTLQILRGAVLTLVFVLAAFPLSTLYGADMQPVLQLTALVLLVSGFHSVGRYIAQRKLLMKRLALFEIAVATVTMAAQILLVWIWPTVWALVLGGVLSTAIAVAASYALVPGLKPRFRLDRKSAINILHFSKWIFLSSLLYFFATNFDRLYLGATIPLAVLGVFGIARGLAETVGNLATRLSNSVIFPAVAAARQSVDDLRAKLGQLRVPLFAAAAFAIAALVAVSDTLVLIIYDERYRLAASILPVLAFGLWFTVLATTAEAILMGLAKPVYGTIANLAKLGWLLVMLPAGIASAGLAGAVVAIAMSDAVKYLATLFGQAREGVAFIRQDIGLTLLFVGTVFGMRAATGVVGINDGWTTWWPMLLASVAR